MLYLSPSLHSGEDLRFHGGIIDLSSVFVGRSPCLWSSSWWLSPPYLCSRVKPPHSRRYTTLPLCICGALYVWKNIKSVKPPFSTIFQYFKLWEAIFDVIFCGILLGKWFYHYFDLFPWLLPRFFLEFHNFKYQKLGIFIT